MLVEIKSAQNDNFDEIWAIIKVDAFVMYQWLGEK